MSDSLRLRVVSSIGDIRAEDWNACALDGALQPESQKCGAALSNTQGYEYNPFTNHDFLHALELSGSVGGRTGWQPRHLIAESGKGDVLGAVPCYLKSHSRGEYVFDRGWAEAYERVGGEYYPKLQVSVPFTPVTGPRLLARPGALTETVRATLTAGLVALCGEFEASSVHLTFLPETQARFLAEQGFLLRTDQQFHWANAGYASPRSPRASARPSGANAPRRWHMA
jgi:predicted N-acyltransferase